ncbi:MAG TPA: protein-glutamate O-methyltransferase CheR [Candidatus Acidoferrum sp.]|nr:protein-glutamate O-methyltransferase CheR [Candidatus Acidoferrum sp.]
MRDQGPKAQYMSSDVLPRPISPKEFVRFQTLIYRESGIWLSDAKTALLTGRLSRRLRALGLNNFLEYYKLVTMDDKERQTMVDAITTNETHFFREPAHFQFLEQQVLPGWRVSAEAGRRPRRIRVWSAGCSTGQEAYSLAMILVDRFPPDQGWSVEIVATDLSRRVLAIAEEGIWAFDKAREIPQHYLRAFMLKGFGQNEGTIKAATSIRVIRFLPLNLNDASYPTMGKFDLIFCRNVLIYFDIESRKRIVEQLLNHLAPEAYLFVGHAESLNSVCSSLRCVVPTVYSFAENRSEVKHAVRR